MLYFLKNKTGFYSSPFAVSSLLESKDKARLTLFTEITTVYWFAHPIAGFFCIKMEPLSPLMNFYYSTGNLQIVMNEN